MIGVIADDLTGAAELGAVGLRYGLRAEVVVAGEPSGEADLVCIDTNSRGCAPEEAGRRAAHAAKLLRACGAGWIYKKVDSVLRGHVLAEIRAVMRQLRLRQALLVPANPSLGRTIAAGRYFIGGQPIDRTEFAQDPEYPRLSSEVLSLLGARSHSLVQVRALHDAWPHSGILVGEAVAAADLEGWARHRTAKLLPAGAAEFFGALLAAAGLKPSRTQTANGPAEATKGALFVCGTPSDSAREFVRAAREHGTPVFSLPPQVAEGDCLSSAIANDIAHNAAVALRAKGRAILNIGLPSVTDRGKSQQFAARLVQVAEAVLQQGGVHQVYAEGGATANELVRCIGWARLSVLRELAPGVATLGVGGAPALQLTIKPGSYTWPDRIQALAQ